MARQRLVKPDVFQHEELHRAELVSALPIIRCYIGLWTQCDRRGLFEWKPGKLKANICPYDAFDFADVLAVLERERFVVSYIVDGKRYGWVPTLPLHQTFNVHEKPNALLPDPPQHRALPGSAPVDTGYKLPGSSSGSSTGTGSVAASGAATDATDDVADAALQLTVAANQAVSAKFGEQIHPLLPQGGPASALASAVLAESIPLDFAAQSIVRQVRDSASEPPRSMRYFAKGIRQDWAGELARRSAGSAPPVRPLERNGRPERTAPPRGASPPPADPDVKCVACGTKEVHEVNQRFVPKHKPGCRLAAVMASVGGVA